MEELPPESRITSLAAGSTLTITIPSSGRSALGCIGGSWSAAAGFAFLGVSCTAQGILIANLLWLIAGLFFCILTGLQLLALRGRFFLAPHTTRLEIAPDSLTELTGATDSSAPQQWLRSSIADIRVQPKPGSRADTLCLHLRDDGSDVYLLPGQSTAELRWIADQIRRKWKLVTEEPAS